MSKFLNRIKNVRNSEYKKKVIDLISSSQIQPDLSELRIKPEIIFQIYKEISASIVFSENLSDIFIHFFVSSGVEKKLIRYLKSRNRTRRSYAALNLAFISSDKVRRALETALVEEKHYYIKVFIINSLTEIGDEIAIPYILQTLIGSPDWYKEKIYAILGQFGEKLHGFLANLDSIDSKELKMVIISFARHYFSPDIKSLLAGFMDSEDAEIASEAAEACKNFYPDELVSEKFIRSPLLSVRRNAVQAAASSPSPESVELLINAMDDHYIYNDCVNALSAILTQRSEYLQTLINFFLVEKNPVIRIGLAKVLSGRMEYFFPKLRADNSEKLKNLLKEIISLGNINTTISFLNENSDLNLEKKIFIILDELIQERTDIRTELGLYLHTDILSRNNMVRVEPQKGEPRSEVVRIGLLRIFLVVAVLAFPVIFVINYHNAFRGLGISGSVRAYIFSYNHFYAFYGISLNSIYLVLLLFSFVGSRRQLYNWKMKNANLLFKTGILPSISIIAPAFREEATIIESVNSLLNLNYPDYEVIVVNDGSTDNTLQVLIDYFNLERVDLNIRESLKTGSIRGLYRNRNRPKLLVVDKINGGKADSLNAGINMASKEYFCGIDADSLLERDSLLKMTSPFLDRDVEIIATGGNIVPINGCTVERGYLADIKIPEHFLSRLQTMEYIRSFISGRVGWATLNCLLIISGAFGLFKKNTVIQSGGYLTGKEKFHKDTVGEDMELVVRLIRHSRASGGKGVVNYVFNANCWTEVPESYAILTKQRDRWHRGLLDIMTFHVKMLFNPRYKEVGLIAFPYFIIFEVIGPWFEVQGLLMFIVALAMGLLDSHIILLLFIGTILMGLAVSVISFYIMERGNEYFSYRDISILIFYAFAENFGVRQYFSVLRLGGYINALRNKQGWGTMVRKGFRTSSGAA